MMPYPELFNWWAITISSGTIFLILVSIYLYIESKRRRKERDRTTADKASLPKGFIFVWVLSGLLVFYIVSINIGSFTIFAAGNMVVEAILIIYLMKNRTKKPKQT